MKVITHSNLTLWMPNIAAAVALSGCSVPLDGYEHCGPPSGTYRVSLENSDMPSTSCLEAVSEKLSRSHDLDLTQTDFRCDGQPLSLCVQVETISVEDEEECAVFMDFNGQPDSDEIAPGPSTAEVKCDDDLYCYHRFDSTYEYLGE